jgi:hypothetical protein
VATAQILVNGDYRSWPQADMRTVLSDFRFRG